jgi:hypothetical protein
MSTITGNNIRKYQAMVIAQALEFYADTGMKVNKDYTPTKMLHMAGKITGVYFEARDYRGAAKRLRQWAEKQ